MKASRVDVIKFTIAIPTYKRPYLLKMAVKSAINQCTGMSYEILVVDNDPESNLEAELTKYAKGKNGIEVRYIRNQENIGMFGNWNKCIEESRGLWVTVLSDDDRLHPGYLSALEEYLSADVSCVYVGKRYYEVGGNENLGHSYVPERSAKKLNPKLFKLFNAVGTPAGLAFRRQIAKKIGGYDPSYYPSADYKFVKELSLHGDVIKVGGEYAFVGVGVNDTLNIETIKGFYKQDLRIRGLRPDILNKIIGVLDIFEQARRFRISSADIFNLPTFLNPPFWLLGSSFRVVKRVLILFGQKSL